MALGVANYKNSRGVIIENAYIRVVKLIGNKRVIVFELDVFANEETANNGILPVETLVYSFVPSDEVNSERWDKQAYEHLKTLEGFKNAVDI